MKKHKLKIEIQGDSFERIMTRLDVLIYIVNVMKETISEKGIVLEDTADSFKFKWDVVEDEA